MDKTLHTEVDITTTSPSFPQRVLIVDDQSTGRTILREIVQSIGTDIEIIEFDNSVDLLKWIESETPNLIITDYRMPNINGIELIHLIRQHPDCHNIPIVMVTVLNDRAVRHRALEAGATAFLTRPIDPVECRINCHNLLTMYRQHQVIQDRAAWLADQVIVATKKIQRQEKETVLTLARAGEYRDEETGYHIIRMAKYSRLIAEQLGMFSTQESEELEYAASMHDIGKIAIPDKILLKSGSLDKEEWQVMQSHTIMGHKLLANSDSRYLRLGAIIALNHHERFDGTGYPNNLKGEAIPLVARVVAVADVFDALLSTRTYKQAWPFEKAIEYIKQQSGSHFDPDCVKALLAQMAKVKQVYSQYVETGDAQITI